MQKSKVKSQKYIASEIEEKWQVIWGKEKVYQPDLDTAKKPFYNLMMFPYPSAEGLHVGNMYAFTGADIYGRFKRMQGFDVFEPIGLDGFGIHSENYAIKVGRHPKEQAQVSEKNFYRQLRATGNAYDWSRTVETYDPDYYKWTQWIFIQLFKAGLAYRKKAPVNFCPKDLTVLADEQVIPASPSQGGDGKCERCGSIVEKRDLEQWFFKITDYADRLLAGLDKIDWTEKVKIAQRQWIGRSEGALIEFKLVLDSANASLEQYSSSEVEKSIEVFTTRPDTLYGATFLVLAPEHPIATAIKDEKVKKYIKQAKTKTDRDRIAADKEKTGVLSGLYAINPLNNEKLPVWIADYALMGYGTGALFGDAHDERDVVFAKKYNIPLKPTLKTGDKEKDAAILSLQECFTGDGILFDSGEFSGLSSKEAREKVKVWLEEHNSGRAITTYHLRDWLISRQRYWGPPIPMIFCEACTKKGISYSSNEVRRTNSVYSSNEVRSSQPSASNNKTKMAGWFPDENLPVLLPEVQDWKPKGSGKSPLAAIESFVNTACPNCGGEAVRETDVSDTFLDSSWYFYRYISTEFKDKAWDKNRAKRWLPVDMYIGGAEHSVLHLLYVRFLTMVFHDLKLVDFEEPFPRFFAHGLLVKEGAKMSKSKGNVVVPDAYIKRYGADTLRTYLMFLGPFSQGGDFYDTSIAGVHRFLQRVHTLVSNVILNSFQDPEGEMPKQVRHDNLERKLAETIKKVTEELEHLRYNTAIAALMELLNMLQTYQKSIELSHLEQFLLMLAPFSPHLAEELWQTIRIKDKGLRIKDQKVKENSSFESIHAQPWPSYDPKMLEKDEVTIVVQINGKVRDQLEVRAERLELRDKIEAMAKEREKIKKHLEGKAIKKVIYVEGKILNFVTE